MSNPARRVCFLAANPFVPACRSLACRGTARKTATSCCRQRAAGLELARRLLVPSVAGLDEGRRSLPATFPALVQPWC